MLDPRQMKNLMKSMGIKMKEIDAQEVIIKTDKEIITIKNPKITEIDQKGLKIYQVIGETFTEPNMEDDIKIIMEQTGVSKEEAKKALEETGDLAEAILKLTESREQ